MKRPKHKIDGWVVLDKPVGLGSTPAVGRVRRLFGAPRRRATAARSIRWPPACCRSPWARRPRPCPSSWTAGRNTASRCCFGEARSTEDAEGEVTATSDVRPDGRRDPRALLPAFMGDIEQMPPVFSALKIDGKRAYDLARAGEAVELKPRHGPDRAPGAARASGRGPCRFRGFLRQRHLYPVPRPRSGATAGDRRTPVGAASHRRRAVPRGSGHFASQTGGPRAYSRRFSGPWPPSRPRWTTSRRWP